MEEEIRWLSRFKVGDLVGMPSPVPGLHPGLVIDIVEREPWPVEGDKSYDTEDWRVLMKSIEGLSGGKRIRVLHPDGLLRVWKPEGLASL